MSQSYQEQLDAISQDPAFLTALATQFRGIERESLRINKDLLIADTPHPKSLGSALCHPQITMDYSEAQLEFVTQVHPRIDTCLYDLHKIHQFAYRNLSEQQETLWAGSMPCALPQDREIPIARFGSSNVATMKSTYRRGLNHRYNDRMQTISGIHYNFSLSERFLAHYQRKLGNQQDHATFKTERYFHLIRNFHRVAPLYVFLFGSSPAFDQSFLPERHPSHNDLLKLNNTFYHPYATSLRMSDIGYTSDAQSSLYICFNKIENYMNALRSAIKEPYATYETIGLTDDQGDYLQLSTSLLQIENEFYSPIRPKRVCASGEAPVNALARGGVEYIEVRCVDIDPFKPMGVDEETLVFLDLLLLYCLLEESPEFDCDTYMANQGNLTDIINRGREPGLELKHPLTPSATLPFTLYAKELLDKLEPIAQLLDKLKADTPYQEVLQKQVNKLNNPALTPSAKVLDAISEYGDYARFIEQQNRKWQTLFNDKPLSSGSLQAFRDAAKNSLAQQQAIEQADTLSFPDYLSDYFKQY